MLINTKAKAPFVVFAKRRFPIDAALKCSHYLYTVIVLKPEKWQSGSQSKTD